jgi:transcriptional regulator with XRE-family HTH domain
MAKITVHGGPSNAADGEGETPPETPRSATPEQHFAANLKTLPEERELSQEALADEMQRRGHAFHQATIYKIESGSRKVQVSEARDLARILGTDIEMMLAPPPELRAFGRIARAIDEYDKDVLQLFKSVKRYNVSRQDLLAEIYEQVESGDIHSTREAIQGYGAGGLVEGETLIYYIQRVQISATSIAKEAETPFYILDPASSGDEGIQIPPTGELSHSQKVQLAEWELEQAENLQRIAHDRLANAEMHLEMLRKSEESSEEEHIPYRSAVTSAMVYAMAAAFREGPNGIYKGPVDAPREAE